MQEFDEEEDNIMTESPDLHEVDSHELSARSLLPPVNAPAGQRSSGASTAASVPMRLVSVAPSRRATDVKQSATKGTYAASPQHIAG